MAYSPRFPAGSTDLQQLVDTVVGDEHGFTDVNSAIAFFTLAADILSYDHLVDKSFGTEQGHHAFLRYAQGTGITVSSTDKYGTIALWFALSLTGNASPGGAKSVQIDDISLTGRESWKNKLVSFEILSLADSAYLPGGGSPGNEWQQITEYISTNGANNPVIVGISTGTNKAIARGEFYSGTGRTPDVDPAADGRGCRVPSVNQVASPPTVPNHTVGKLGIFSLSACNGSGATVNDGDLMLTAPEGTPSAETCHCYGRVLASPKRA